MSEIVASRSLTPGTQLQHRDGKIVTLDRRKDRNELAARRTLDMPVHEGWWLTDGSGLADFVIDKEDADWVVL